VRERVARSRELVAVVTRVMQVTRQAIYRTPKPRTSPQRRPAADDVERAIVEVAKENPTDGYRMVWALVRRKLGRAVNRKRVLRVMREHRLIQRRRRQPRRKRPGFFRVERPDQLWHLDLTAVWVAEHGWCYLMAAIDCCTREIVGWQLELRCRALEAIALIERAARERGIEPGMLTLGTDNGSAFTARRFKQVLSALGIAHRRGGYRDPESQAFIESWFGKLKEREVWREEYETLEDARGGIGGYVDGYHEQVRRKHVPGRCMRGARGPSHLPQLASHRSVSPGARLSPLGRVVQKAWRRDLPPDLGGRARKAGQHEGAIAQRAVVVGDHLSSAVVAHPGEEPAHEARII
jgi:putative transposase